MYDRDAFRRVPGAERLRLTALTGMELQDCRPEALADEIERLRRLCLELADHRQELEAGG